MDDRARERISKAEQIVRDWQAEWLSGIGSPAALAELKWAIAGAISAYGDEREREALEQAATVVEQYHFSSPTYVANRVRSLIKTTLNE